MDTQLCDLISLNLYLTIVQKKDQISLTNVAVDCKYMHILKCDRVHCVSSPSLLLGHFSHLGTELLQFCSYCGISVHLFWIRLQLQSGSHDVPYVSTTQTDTHTQADTLL